MRSVFFFSSRRRHTRLTCDWSSDVCSSDLACSVIMDGRLVNSCCVMGVETRDASVTTIEGIGRAEGLRSEERRVGKEWRSGGGREHQKKEKAVVGQVA